MIRTRRLLLILMIWVLWMAPLRDAEAKFEELLQGGKCQPASLLFLLHVGGGLVVPLWRPPQYPDAKSSVQGALELGTALQCAVQGDKSRGLMVFPELGYSLTFASGGESEPDVLTHLLRVGAGLGYGNSMANITYVPRLVLGARGSSFAVGLRHGAIAHFAYDLLSVEISQQFLKVDGYFESDVRFVASANVLAVLLVAAALKR